MTGTQQQQQRRHAGAAPLPSPLEATAAGGSDARAMEQRQLKRPGAAQALSAQTVTTTTVTTTTVTTYPPLRLPRVRRHKVLAPEMYPLAATPAPPALERFAVDMNGQSLYFSQHDIGAFQTGEGILASIAANNALAGDSAPPAAAAAAAAFAQSEHLQRAMTPLYTQDDEDAAAAAAAAAATGETSPLLESFAYAAPGRHPPRAELPAVRLGLGSRSRRSSSPPSPSQQRQFGRRSPSPAAHRRRRLQLEPTAGSANEHSDSEFDVASPLPVASSLGGDAIDSADDDGAAVLPLPSPLLSPRARPEPMDTDDVIDHAVTAPATTTTTTTHTDVTQAHMSRSMAAVYEMPEMVAAYDSLPPTMQTYLLYQLLRRTPRPGLQFAAQAVVPVLQRDFLGELPAEVAHHVLRFMGTRELCRAACASRAWRRVVDGDRAVWRARLTDAHYVPEAPRVHPLCYTYFGLGDDEPARSILAPRLTAAELDLAQLAP
ncbi:SCF ubiquitin ligase complex subunit cdc4, partial [Coemansia nantahalensis]